MIDVQFLGEYGYRQALFGLGLSHGKTSGCNYFTDEWSEERMVKVARTLASKDGGHNKFLEAIHVWLDISAPLYWWKQFDTYRVGVTKQSESTMHTLGDSPLTQENFAQPIPGDLLEHLNTIIEAKGFDRLNNLLPQGFIQRRVVCVNYKTLRNMIQQRSKHKLEEWRFFVNEVLSRVRRPELLRD